MKCRNIDLIELNVNCYKPINKYNKIKKCVGLDTETEKGKAFLIAYYQDEKNNYIQDTKEVYEQLTFLNNKYFKDKFNFFYNITYDFQAIIKDMPISNLKEIGKYDETIYDDFNIKILPEKMFSITKSKQKYTNKFYDLAQFFNHNSLNKSAIKFLGLKKDDLKENDIDISNLNYNKYKNDIDYKFTLNKYLKKDCILTKQLADKLYNMVSPYIKPRYFYSQASFSQQYFLENIKKQMNLPTLKIMKMALDSYQGGRFETIKRGYFDKVYISDIKSAYPYHNIQVPDTSNGEWKESLNYEPESLISLFKVNTDISDINISPSKYQNKNNLLIYPVGKFKDLYINKKEYETISDLGFDIKIKQAYHYFDKEPEFPFLFLKKFYNLKEKYKQEGNTELSMIPKIIINGFYGKTIQVNPYLRFSKKNLGDENLHDLVEYNNKLIYVYKYYKGGILFNPVVANEITANTRVQLFNSAKKYMKNVIGFQTDSIITDKKINLNYKQELGGWEIDKKGEMVILGSGIYQLLGDNPKVRFRGFGKKIDLYNALKKNDLDIPVKRNIKLKQLLRLKIDDKEKNEIFNLLIDDKKQINLNFDKKRIWDRNFINSDDVLNNSIDSKPIII